MKEKKRVIKSSDTANKINNGMTLIKESGVKPPPMNKIRIAPLIITAITVLNAVSCFLPKGDRSADPPFPFRPPDAVGHA